MVTSLATLAGPQHPGPVGPVGPARKRGAPPASLCARGRRSRGRPYTSVGGPWRIRSATRNRVAPTAIRVAGLASTESGRLAIPAPTWKEVATLFQRFRSRRPWRSSRSLSLQPAAGPRRRSKRHARVAHVVISPPRASILALHDREPGLVAHDQRCHGAALLIDEGDSMRDRLYQHRLAPRARTGAEV